MSSEMFLSPSPSFSTVDESLTSRDDQSISELSQDDIEAAQTLEDLRRESRKSPSAHYADSISGSDSGAFAPQRSEPPEPLLSLLTSHHPLISNAITGSLSAYTSSKDYSRSFKYGAEFVERLGSPVVTTVGTAGRISGVETGVRWWLKRPAGPSEDHRNKRGRLRGQPELDVEKGYQDPVAYHPVNRSLSVASSETLPAYDDHRSPQYVEIDSSQSSCKASEQKSSQTWSSKLVITTSGLGVAMRQESLDCLKYCLEWTRWANNHLGRITSSLKDIMETPEHQQSASASDAQAGDPQEPSPGPTTQSDGVNHDANRRIDALSHALVRILADLTNVVSQYAGAALPENARNLVMRRLASLPHRFRLLSRQQRSSSSESMQSSVSLRARSVLHFAHEGLDMITQISGVLNGTIASAEEWCDRLGRQGGRNGRISHTSADAKDEPKVNGHRTEAEMDTSEN